MEKKKSFTDNKSLLSINPFDERQISGIALKYPPWLWSNKNVPLRLNQDLQIVVLCPALTGEAKKKENGLFQRLNSGEIRKMKLMQRIQFLEHSFITNIKECNHELSILSFCKIRLSEHALGYKCLAASHKIRAVNV